MSETSARIGLPLLAVAQAQKEMTHNEALAMLDIAVLPVVEAVAPIAVPTAPLPGQCWIVGATPTDAWAGQAGAIAGWTAGGWRFLLPSLGMAVWSNADKGWVRRTEGGWMVAGQGAAIADPAGGATIDGEARTAVTAVLAVLRAHGLIAA